MPAAPQRFVLGYAVGWLALAALLIPLFVVSGALSWTEAVLFLIPLTGVYAAVCGSSRYLASSSLLEGNSFARVLFVVVPAVVASGFWTLLAALSAPIAARALPAPDMASRFNAQLPLLFGVGVLVYLLYTAFNELGRQAERSRLAEVRAVEATMMARDAELRALKAQVNPHFLFNSLHSISALTSIDPARARETCILLADFLRSTLGLGDRAAISFGEELDLTRKYLGVEQVRFPGRMEVEESISPDSLDVLVPPLLLQPLFENAVKHGVSTMSSGGWLKIRAGIQDGALLLELDNAYDPEAPVRRGHGVGLSNVRKRLEARYGDAAGITAVPSGSVWTTRLRLPVERKEKA